MQYVTVNPCEFKYASTVSLFYSADISIRTTVSHGWDTQVCCWSLDCRLDVCFMLNLAGTACHREASLLTKTKIVATHKCTHTHIHKFCPLHTFNSSGTSNSAFVKGKPSCARSNLWGPQTNKLALVLKKALGSVGFKYTLDLLPHWFPYTSESSVSSQPAAHMVPTGLG